MAYIKKADRRKNQYQKISFDFKLSVIDEIYNGLISIIHAAKVTTFLEVLINFRPRGCSCSKSKTFPIQHAPVWPLTNGCTKPNSISGIMFQLHELEILPSLYPGQTAASHGYEVRVYKCGNTREG